MKLLLLLLYPQRDTKVLTAPPVTFEVGTTGARLFTLKTVGYDEYSRKILEEGGMISGPAEA